MHGREFFPIAWFGCLAGLTVFAAVIKPLRAFGQQTGTSAVVVVSDEPPEDDGGNFPYFLDPLLNATGQAVFSGYRVESGFGLPPLDDRLLIGDGIGPLVEIARSGQTAPLGGEYLSFDVHSFNEKGRVAFEATLSPDGMSGLFVAGGVDSASQIVREGDAVPGGEGVFDQLDLADVSDDDRMSFTASIDSGEQRPPKSVVVRDLNGSLRTVLREGDPAPEGSGICHGVFLPSLNNNGQAGFAVRIEVAGEFETGYYRDDGPGTLIRVARTGDEIPDGTGKLSTGISSAQINSAGQLVISANVIGMPPLGDGQGLFVADGMKPLVTILREGQDAPDGNGRFAAFGRPSINDSGQVFFFADLDGTRGGVSDDVGIFRGDGSGPVTQIARRGQPLPDGGGTFLFPDVRSSSAGVLNNGAGQVVFLASLSGTPLGDDDDAGIYFFDEAAGLIKIAREGDALLGSTIAELGLKRVQSNLRHATALNDAGQVAYRFVLADGNEGIAIWTPPGYESGEPREVEITVGEMGSAVLDWKAPDSIQQSVETSESLTGPWAPSLASPVLLEPGSWQWQELRSPRPAQRYFRIRW
ncbi:MAG: hypothetical protein KDN22_31215 [Verrucomicrobiae bacterium]|nr:hypothetical protein [Verrucomicrobiae bacterium]